MVDSCLHGQETQVQHLHGKLPGSYITPEMQVELYSLTTWMRVWCREEEFWQSRNQGTFQDKGNLDRTVRLHFNNNGARLLALKTKKVTE